MNPPIRVARLAATHNRAAFESGSEALDRYFRAQVTQDVRRRFATCFVASQDDVRVDGFYTLAMASVALNDMDAAEVKRLPRYPDVPFARLGRLAVDKQRQGAGLGRALLWSAIQRTLQSEIAAYALIVEAKDDDAAAFYRRHDFRPLPGRERTLVLTLADASTQVTPSSAGVAAT